MSKPDLAGSDLYRVIARALLKEQHNYLFEKVKDHVQQNPRRSQTIGIFGTGQEALPFGDRLNELFSINPDLNVVFLDYNPDVLFGNAERNMVGLYKFLRNRSFSKGRHFFGSRDQTFVPQGNEGRCYFFVSHNFKNELPFLDASIDCIDSTLSLHHATQNYDLIESIGSELHRVLSPGGLFHWGTGVVDMKFPNEKMGLVRKITQEVTGSGVAVIDNRDVIPGRDSNENFSYRIGPQGQDVLEIKVEYYEPSGSPVSSDKQTYPHACIMIPANKEEAEKLKTILQDNGFVDIQYGVGNLVLPLIDPKRKEDIERHIAGCDKHYSIVLEILNRELPKTVGGKSVRGAINAIEKEYSDAKRGIVEFYTKPEVLEKYLAKTGFTNIHTHRNKDGLLSNITCVKP